MNGKILGGYVFTSKKGKTFYKLTLSDDVSNALGSTAQDVFIESKYFKYDLKDVIGRNCVVDESNRFGSAIFLTE